MNWLGHAVLIELLGPHLAAGAPIVVTASGTHDPANRLARVFGFRGGLFAGVEKVARGQLDPAASPAQQAKDFYATSKLCTLLHAHALARRLPVGAGRVIAFDPGLMPGTGLARDRNALGQWAWSAVLPVVVGPLPGTSTAQRSGAALADLLLGRALAEETGRHVDFRLLPATSSADSLRQEWQHELDAFALAVTSTVATTGERHRLLPTP